MIILKIYGGLGNQMFQYAFGSAISQKYNLELKLDTSWFENIGPNTTKRYYQLDIFNISKKVASLEEVNKITGAHKSILSKIKRKIFQVQHKASNIITEENFDRIQHFVSCGEDFVIDGYWQDQVYFESYRKELLEVFKFPKFTDSINLKIVAKISEIPDTVSIHVRRGDYLTDKKINAHHGLCSIDYYKSAIGYFCDMGVNNNYLIFSDDPQWCKDEFKFLGRDNYYVVDNNRIEKDAFYDMHLMSLCNHHIIANSTFSWWGAWLANSRKVIAPKNWFNSGKKTPIIPKNWLSY